MSRPTTNVRRSTKTEYIETDTGNKIARRAHIDGKTNIMLGGKSVVMAGAHLRGDLQRLPEPSADGEPVKVPSTTITIGKASIISTNCTIHPPMRYHNGKTNYYPMRIGDGVFIGQGTYVSSAVISSHAHIGENCVLGAFSMIREYSKVLPDTVVPPHMTVPSGTIVAGRPARIIGEVGDGHGQGTVGEGDEWVIEGGDLRALVRSLK